MLKLVGRTHVSHIHHPHKPLGVTCPSKLSNAKLLLSAIYSETRTPATHVHGMRHGTTSAGGLMRRNSDMERKFKYI